MVYIFEIGSECMENMFVNNKFTVNAFRMAIDELLHLIFTR
jgi:hypothetical protein